MSMDKHYIVVADSLLSRLGDLGVDTLKRYINRFYGVIQLKNQTDSTIVLSNNNLSNLSFALAILNEHNTGIVLNGIYGRDTSNIYAKPIVEGKCEYALSKEEKEALDKAIK